MATSFDFYKRKQHIRDLLLEIHLKYSLGIDSHELTEIMGSERRRVEEGEEGR